MTVGEMRELMRRRVVPEDLVPQNVVGLLMDEEDAAPPVLDAFTFLTRLRALGIGSADFMYLMEGCGAPQSVVDKIKNNPAMNLQGLILTLESSELAADDYSRILYTARQIWERTLTLRLRKSEMALRGGAESEDCAEPSFEEVMDGLDKPIEDIAESDILSDYDEFREAFVTEELVPPVGEEILEEETVGEEPVTEETAELEPVGEETAELPPVEEETFEEESPEEEPTDEYPEYAEYDDRPAYTEEIEPLTPQPYNGDTTTIIQIDAEMLKKSFADLAGHREPPKPLEETDPVRAEAIKIAAEKAQREAREALEKARAEEAAKLAAEQAARQAEEEPEDRLDEEFDELPEEIDEEEELDGEPEERKPEKRESFVVRIPNERPYHKGAIITAAVGAAVVFGAAVAVPLIPEAPVIRNITYAEDNAEIFNEIYYSYYDNVVGGEKAVQPVVDYNKIFGDLLVTAESFGAFSSGDNVYVATSEAVSVSLFKNGVLIPLEDILPPDGTEIINVLDERGELIAVFSGSGECGFMRIANGKTLFTVRQDGFMTDFGYKDGDILIGSVYTPRFTRTFGIQDAMVYMPTLGVNEKNALEPQKVIPSGTKGYTYGISAAYSADNGANRSAVAALGDPITASVDGRFVMSGEEDLLLTVGEEEITAVKAEGIRLAAFCADGSATYENGSIILRDRSGAIVAAASDLAQTVTALRFYGDMLRINGEHGVFATLDCSDFANAKAIELKPADGAVIGENAVVFGTAANTVTLTLYKLENGAAKPSGTYAKALSQERLDTLEFGGSNTVIADGVRFGAAYRYFDGVSVISEFAVADESGQTNAVKELYDDRAGYTLAFKHGGNVYAVCGGGIVDVLN